ncbi:hypothetical protein, variant, partial [Salpingoeca rosetta]
MFPNTIILQQKTLCWLACLLACLLARLNTPPSQQHTMTRKASVTPLRFIHFNDVERVHEAKTEPVGGIARFITAINKYEDTTVLFSGDAFNPSILSSATKGHHMVPCLNAAKIEVACYGNHDFDFGEEELKKLSQECTFPWVMTNLTDSQGVPTGTAKKKHVFEKQGVRIGVMGLAEKDWIDTLSDPPEDIQYRDFIETAQEYIKILREEDECDLVIALTHMRENNDLALAKACPEIDLVLGGHDHFYRVTQLDNNIVIKSGMDFKNFSVIEVTLNGDARPSVAVERVDVTSEVEPDSDMAAYVKEADEKYATIFDKVVGYTEVEWNVHNSSVRTEENAFGNLVAGLLRARYGADLCILAGGSFRSDRVYPAGPVTARVVSTIFPFTDACVVLEVTGKTVWAALENGVSKYPQHEGRFPQVSGLRMTFDPSLPPGSRLVEVTVGEDREPLDVDKTYTLATRGYMADGHDGYTALKGSKIIVDPENGSLLSTIVVQALTKVEVIKAWKRKHMILRSAIAAFRGVRPFRPKKKEEQPKALPESLCGAAAKDPSCIVVRPQLDGRICIVGVTPPPLQGSPPRAHKAKRAHEPTRGQDQDGTADDGDACNDGDDEEAAAKLPKTAIA